RDRISSSLPRRARSFTTTRIGCSPMATAGSARSPRTWRSTRRIGEGLGGLMLLSTLFFYLFAGMCVASAFMVIAVKNPVHAVLFLILAFFNAAGLFVLLGAEFLAMILVVVYVGAVLVLFLFVVMMLDVDFAVLRAGFLKYLPVGATIGILLLVELILILVAWVTAPDITAQAPTPPVSQMSNTMALGQILYTKYVYLFEGAGLILLVAMIGAIVLTLQHKRDVKRQSVVRQVARTRESGVEVVEVETGRGLS